MEISSKRGELSAGRKAARAVPCTGSGLRQKKIEGLACSLLVLTQQGHLLSQLSEQGSARTGSCCFYFYPFSKQRMELEKIWTYTSPSYEDNNVLSYNSNLFTLEQLA